MSSTGLTVLHNGLLFQWIIFHEPTVNLFFTIGRSLNCWFMENNPLKRTIDHGVMDSNIGNMSNDI